MRMRILPLLLVVGLFAGCGGGDDDSDSSSAKAQPLVGTTWELQEITGTAGKVTKPASGEPPTLTFRPGKKVAIFTGCNSGSGSAVIQGPDQGAEVEFGRIALTLKACLDPTTAKVEDLMVKAFAQMDVIEVPKDGSGMTLATSGPVEKGGTPLEFRFQSQ
ncbi:MAG: META domain-containing protein [Thermoleophilia bacterium]|nr:META domain-containing protein [Thermoleophilia bacterium]